METHDWSLLFEELGGDLDTIMQATYTFLNGLKRGVPGQIKL